MGTFLLAITIHSCRAWNGRPEVQVFNYLVTWWVDKYYISILMTKQNLLSFYVYTPLPLIPSGFLPIFLFPSSLMSLSLQAVS